MSYLRLYDYISNIQSTTLNQVVQGNDAVRILKESASKSQIISYLVQKFDTDAEFQDTTIFKTPAIYQANSLVELNYPVWDATVASYVVGTFITYNGACYVCILATTIAHEPPTNTTYWQLVSSLYDLYYLAFPYPLFQVKNFYAIGDRVFWKGKIYECAVPTTIPNHFSQINDFTYQNIPLQNVLPDNKINGKKYWGDGTIYTVSGLIPNAPLPTAWSAGSYLIGDKVLYNGSVWQALTNNSVEPSKDIINWQSESWIFGDNRNAQIVECMVWITIRKLSPLISPRNIPVLWDTKYTECLTWLQMCAQGDITLQAPEIQPQQGSRIRFGGTVKQQNGY